MVGLGTYFRASQGCNSSSDHPFLTTFFSLTAPQNILAWILAESFTHIITWPLFSSNFYTFFFHIRHFISATSPSSSEAPSIYLFFLHPLSTRLSLSMSDPFSLEDRKRRPRREIADTHKVEPATGETLNCIEEDKQRLQDFAFCKEFCYCNNKNIKE